MADPTRRPRRLRLHEPEELDDDLEAGFEADEDLDELDEEGPLAARRASLSAPRLRRRPRRAEADEESFGGLVRDVPRFVKMLGGLMLDPRVSRIDKALVGGALAYTALPVDVLPDIPVVGQIDDVVLIGLAVNRLLNNAGVDVLLDHWDGEVASLERALSLLERVDSFLPAPVRMLLGRRAG